MLGLEAGIANQTSDGTLHPELFCSRVRALLRQKSATDRLEQSDAVLFTLAQAVEQRDGITSRHCERMAVLSLELGMVLGLGHKELATLYGGCFLHDIGKVGIPDSILFKKGPLSAEEWTVMHTHTTRGEQICRQLKSLEGVLPIIRSHHERWDGSGYPDGLRGKDIPLLARILQISDIYDALTSARPYKLALSPEQALDIMRQETARGWRDPELVSLFERNHDKIAAKLVEFGQSAGTEDSLRNLALGISARN
jgi:putative two-component system response regulator